MNLANLGMDEDTPVLLILTVEGVLVFDNKDIHLQATYIWVKGGTFEIGTEERPFRHRALITLHGQKYSTIRLPVIGGKVLAVSNTQFTIREQGDNAIEEGNIGTLDIHGMPRLKVWTRLAQTANAGDRVIVLQDIVDWKPGEELMVAATDIPHKHFDGNGLHGAPPMDFHNERVYVESVASDMKTITLTAPLEFTHISTFFTRPLDDEYIDLSAEAEDALVASGVSDRLMVTGNRNLVICFPRDPRLVLGESSAEFQNLEANEIKTGDGDLPCWCRHHDFARLACCGAVKMPW
ncbi:PKHD1L1 [Symbiodinium sp. CCMP2592]|nr:PKHD1L1 [Symbiodinium sp. CCMP2592]